MPLIEVYTAIYHNIESVFESKGAYERNKTAC